MAPAQRATVMRLLVRQASTGLPLPGHPSLLCLRPPGMSSMAHTELSPWRGCCLETTPPMKSKKRPRGQSTRQSSSLSHPTCISMAAGKSQRQLCQRLCPWWTRTSGIRRWWSGCTWPTNTAAGHVPVRYRRRGQLRRIGRPHCGPNWTPAQASLPWLSHTHQG